MGVLVTLVGALSGRPVAVLRGTTAPARVATA